MLILEEALRLGIISPRSKIILSPPTLLCFLDLISLHIQYQSRLSRKQSTSKFRRKSTILTLKHKLETETKLISLQFKHWLLLRSKVSYLAWPGSLVRENNNQNGGHLRHDLEHFRTIPSRWGADLELIPYTSGSLITITKYQLT